MAVFELDTYVVNAGKLDALLARFRDHTMRLFERHGICNVGYWLSEKEDVDEPDVLVYLLAHPSTEQALANWAAFGADPEWMEAYHASMIDGPLVASRSRRFLTPTDFSPLGADLDGLIRRLGA